MVVVVVDLTGKYEEGGGELDGRDEVRREKKPTGREQGVIKGHGMEVDIQVEVEVEATIETDHEVMNPTNPIISPWGKMGYIV